MINGFYINLDERKDRFDYFENVKSNNSFLKNIKRFPAIKNSNGALGCSMSHYNALKVAYENYKYDECIAILEDDFFILDQNVFNEFVNDFNVIKNNDNWSVITFTRRAGTYYGKYNETFNFIRGTQTMSGYIVKTNFINTLLKQLEIGITNMENGLSEHNNTCDQIWKPLQKDNKFIYYNRVIAGQLPCYSDLEQRVVDYNRHYINEKNIVYFIFLIIVSNKDNIDSHKQNFQNIPSYAAYFYILQDNSIDNDFKFDNANNILYIKKLDNEVYDRAKIIISALNAVNSNFNYKYILKLNDNTQIINYNILGKLLDMLIANDKYQYGGKILNNGNKKYCDKSFYFLSNKAISNLLEKREEYYNYGKDNDNDDNDDDDNDDEKTGFFLDNIHKNTIINFDTSSIFKIV